jgi:hypothetical protein
MAKLSIRLPFSLSIDQSVRKSVPQYFDHTDLLFPAAL